MSSIVGVPGDFAERTAAREGEAGREWIESLPTQVAALVDRWRLTLRFEAMVGTVGLVWEVTREDSTPAVLKVSWQDVWSRDEGLALRAWGGRGAVRLLEHDVETGSMLLERLEPDQSLLKAPLNQAIEAVARVARQLHVLPGHGFTGVLEQDDEDLRFSGKYKATLEKTRPAVEEAIEGLAPVLLHGDLHYANILRAGLDWRAIDPKPAAGPIEWEYIALLRNRFNEYDSSKLNADIQRRLERLLDLGGGDRREAYLFARYRALLDADYAHRTNDTEYEDVSVAIADAMQREVG